MRLAFDMSSILWTALKTGKDPEGREEIFEGEPVWVNTSAYAYEFVINMMTAAMRDAQVVPCDVILVFEGLSAKKRRLMIDPLYKASRGEKSPGQYEEFGLLKDQLDKLWRGLGAITLTQDFVEGDDLLAWLALHTKEDLMVASNDGDLAAMDGTNQHGAIVEVRINGEISRNPYGPFALHRITMWKALVGDSSDNIKGCPGFGKAAFIDFVAKYGEDGLDELQGLLEKGNLAELDTLDKCKLIEKLKAGADTMIRSYKLAKLHPEWCNTMKQPVRWGGGMVIKATTDERLKQWNAGHRLVTADNYNSALEFLRSQFLLTPGFSFDIETSTPDESDEWLEGQGKKPGEGVDVIGSILTGFSITFGPNRQYSYYVSVDHAHTRNVTMQQARVMIEAMFGRSIFIQNTAFELVVLYGAKGEDGSLWRDHWEKYGQNGFIPCVLDTKLEASYVNENMRLGLKERSLYHLGYRQQTYDETTLLTGDNLPAGGLLIHADGDVLTKRYKMRELTAAHVFDYGVDDTVCTAGLHNLYKLIMQLEGSYEAYQEIEIDAAYLHALNFYKGTAVSIAKSKQLEHEDDVTYSESWPKVRAYLMAHGWDGTVPPVYTPEVTVKQLKEAYAIVTGQVPLTDEEDEPEEVDEDADADEDDTDPTVEAAPATKDSVLTSKVRTPSKLVALVRAEGEEELATFMEAALAGNAEPLTKYVQARFKGEPRWKFSNGPMCKLLYKVMGLPIKVRNKATAKMRAKGIHEGNPKGDALAIAYALRDCTPEQKEILEALKLVQMVRTRRSLYYKTYPYLVHWKTGRIHSSHNQCATNTRRASSSGPNLQQLAKHQKIEGQAPRFREVIIPHRKGAVIVSMDFAAQELRVIAEYSQDPGMLSCFVGDDLKDMHAMTGTGILQRQEKSYGWSLEVFMEALKDPSHEKFKTVKIARDKGKKTNFTTEYGAAAPKLAQTLLISEDEAQDYIDAKEAAFPVAAKWKLGVVAEAKRNGYVLSMCGVPRHLAELLNSENKYTASKAERQSVNFKVQGSSAEMTKKAEGRMWAAGLFTKFDAVCVGPIHDEVVASVMIGDLPEFLPLMHACMVAPFASMQVPIISSISFGPDFGRQVEIGEQPVSAAIAKGLEEMAERFGETTHA